MKRLFASLLVSAVIAFGLAGNVFAQNQNTSEGTTSASEANNSGLYVSMGDSVASGLGLAPAAGDNRCGRSTEAYGYKVAASQNLRWMHAACSGATAGDLFTRQGISGPNIAPQLDSAFSYGTPKLITITAGANDMRWNDFLRKCASTDCGKSADTTAANTLRAAYKLKLEYAFQEIQRLSNNQPPTVVITGYSNPVSNYCKNRQQYVSNTEINWLNGQRDQLNKAIRDVAGKYSFVKYASTNFDSHSICSPDPWMQGLNEAAPLHPNAAGQQAIADSINKVLQ